MSRGSCACVTYGWSMGLLLLVGSWSTGCSIMQERTNSPMTSVEQVLLTQAVERGLSELSLPLVPGTSVAIQSFGFTPDKDFARRLVESWFLTHGYRVVGYKAAPITVRLLIHALGTESGESFFGVPPINSGFIPIALPELALYRAAEQKGIARFQLELTDSATGTLVHRSRLFEGTVYFNQYTVLLWISFQRTDLLPPPPTL